MSPVLLFASLLTSAGGLKLAMRSMDTEQLSCINPNKKCEGIFEYVPGTSKTVTLAQQPKNLWNVQLPFAQNPSDAKDVASCHEMWKKSTETVGNKQLPRSTWNEDVTVYNKYFANKTGTGVFLEMGAFDGIVESNSLFYERCLGWKGLLIEGNKAKFQQLVVNRPSADKLNLIPSCAKDDSTMSFVTSNTYTSASQANMVNEHGTQAEKDFIKQGGTETMHCGPLHLYLKDLGIHKIDFYSLDVEGAELEVLKTFDFDAVKVGVLMVESRNRYCEDVCPKRDAVRELIKSKGGTLHEGVVQKSDIFTWD